MTPDVEHALATDRVIDITTTGRRSGQPRRIEIWFHRVDGRYYITGSPGARGWYANLLAHPEFTFHLKRSAKADLPARAIPVEGDEKRRVLAAIAEAINVSAARLNADTSPLVEVVFTDGT
jgi:deazaflavin-dependent oxidoreductase (nitroreductase family)